MIRNQAWRIRHAHCVRWDKVSALCASMIAGAAVGVIGLPGRLVSTGIVACVLIAPLIYLKSCGVLLRWEALFWANVALAVMFVLRPLLILQNDDFMLRDQTYFASTFNGTMAVVLVGCTAIQAGYFLGATRSLRLGQYVRGLKVDARHLASGGYVLVGLAVVSSLLLVLSGSRPFGDVTNQQAALYLLPYTVIPGSLLLIGAGYVGKRSSIVGSGGLIASISVPAMLVSGHRLWGILMLVAVLVVVTQLWDVRIHRVVLVVSIAIGGLALTSLRVMEADDGPSDAISVAAESVTDPYGSIGTLFLGPDSEMFDGLASVLLYVPREMEFRPGMALVSTVLHPIPRAIWPGRPRPPDDVINDVFVDNRWRGADKPQVATSVFGNFYMDSGLFGVGLGMLLLGLGMGATRDVAQLARKTVPGALVTSLWLPFMVVLMRGSLPFSFGRTVFILAPLIAVIYLASRRRT